MEFQVISDIFSKHFKVFLFFFLFPYISDSGQDVVSVLQLVQNLMHGDDDQQGHR